MRAYCYHRVSDPKALNKEDKYSLGEQAEMTRRYCQEKGYEIVGECKEAHTGFELDERPEMTRIRQMIRRREIDVLILISLDRLARNQNHQAVVIYECERYNVKVELVLEVYEDTPIGRHMRSTMAFVAEIERERIRERTMRGKRGRVKSGKIMPGGRPKYGYLWSNPERHRKEHFVVNPETAPIVERIFQEAASGKPMRRIAIELGNEGILSPTDYWRVHQGQAPKGIPWQKSVVWGLLVDPAYCGQHSAFRYECIKRKEFDERGEPVSRQVQIERPVDGGVRVMLSEEACPPIVSEETYRSVQLCLDRNKALAARNNKHPEDTLMRGGFVKCGLCGKNMIVYYAGDGRPLYRCYRPAHQYGTLPCKGSHIAARSLDVEVWRRVLDVMQRPEIIEEQINSNQGGGYTDTIEGYKHRLADLERQRGQLARAIGILDESESDALLAQYKHLGQQKADAEREMQTLVEMQRHYEQWQEGMRQVSAWCRAMSAIEWSYERKRQALIAFNVEVTVWPADHNPRWKVRIGHLGEPIESGLAGSDCVLKDKTLPSTS